MIHFFLFLENKNILWSKQRQRQKLALVNTHTHTFCKPWTTCTHSNRLTHLFSTAAIFQTRRTGTKGAPCTPPSRCTSRHESLDHHLRDSKLTPRIAIRLPWFAACHSRIQSCNTFVYGVQRYVGVRACQDKAERRRTQFGRG